MPGPLVRTTPQQDEPQRWTTLIGAARAAFGVLLMLAPGALTRPLGVDRETSKRLSWLSRMIAGRELALGAGTLAGMSGGQSPRPWLLLNAVSDAADGATLTLAMSRGRVRRLAGIALVLFAAGGVAGESVLYRRAGQ